jgi:hypothetical protein
MTIGKKKKNYTSIAGYYFFCFKLIAHKFSFGAAFLFIVNHHASSE